MSCSGIRLVDLDSGLRLVDQTYHLLVVPSFPPLRWALLEASSRFELRFVVVYQGPQDSFSSSLNFVGQIHRLRHLGCLRRERGETRAQSRFV